MSNIGDNVRLLRKSRGWTAQRLSDELNGSLSRAVISDLETGRKHGLSLEAGVALAKVFGVTAEELLTGEAATAIRRAELESCISYADYVLQQLKSELRSLDERQVVERWR